MTRAMAMWEAATLSERWVDIRYAVWYSLTKGYCVRHDRDGAQEGMERVAVFLGGDIYVDA